MNTTTLTVWTLQPGTTRWGLTQMGIGPLKLRQVAGLRFAKMLGSGHNFGLKPNFRRYALMAVWESAEAADTFFATNAWYQHYLQHTTETCTVWLAPLKAHGLWDGTNPFDYATETASADGPVAILTRASIKLGQARSFWQAVPAASAPIAQAAGVRAAIGLGELPFIRQATFSLWDSAAAMQQYAYRSQQHQEVIRRTRQEKWYSEELFARFRVLRSEGTWDGQPL